jgi:hypothetical protein
MLPLHYDPGRDTSCRGLRLVQSIGSVLTTTLSESRGGRIRTGGLKSPSLRIGPGLPRPGHSSEQPVWESNPPLRLERAVSSADRRTSHRVGRGALESPSAGLQPAAGPSQLPSCFVVPTKRPGVFVTPGLRLRARDVRGPASRPQGIEPKRARRRIGGSLRFLATQDVTPTSNEHERPRCNGRLRPAGHGTDLTARPVVFYPYRRLTPGGCSRDFEEILGLARADLPPTGSRAGVQLRGPEPRERAASSAARHPRKGSWCCCDRPGGTSHRR